jgi:hypothetical protein
MGRKKKYNTDEERIEAQREYNRKYYEKNKSQINKKRMVKYYEQKEQITK